MNIAGLIMSVGPKIPVWVGWAAIILAAVIFFGSRKWRKK